MKLFKVSVKHKWRKERKCFYAVAETKDLAKEYVEKKLIAEYEVSHVSELGEQLGMYLYAGKLKKGAF